MPQEIAHENSVSRSGDQAAGSVAKPVEANRPQSGSGATPLVATKCRGIKPPPIAITEHVIVRLKELFSVR